MCAASANEAADNAPPNWTKLLQTHLPVSVRAANETLSRVPAIQKWMRTTASEIAAEQPPTAMQDATHAMHGYSTARRALNESFPDLRDAIRTTTNGLGTLDLDWRPFSPHLSQVQVTFSRDYDVDAFMRVDDATRSALNTHLDTMQNELPESEPFPRRPHTRTALWAHSGEGVGVRIHRHHPNDDVHRHTFALLPPGEKPTTDLQREALLTQLLNRWA
ncbi:MAG: hypothetical protein R6U20_12385 [Longimonas sp.]|uniref:hypothetical protein n=1 Tax=Longimonas sp. TaxID=2039626 RepID=UPI0039771F59